MTRAYGGIPVAQGTGSTDRRRPRVARGRPNWWVILAVSLALMALLVATSGNPRRAVRGSGAGTHGIAGASASDAHGGRGASGSSRSTSTARATTTTTSAPQTAATALTSTHAATVPT